MHAPIGFTSYRLGKNLTWADVYAKQFVRLVDKYSHVVRYILAGHYHHASFQLTPKNVPTLLHYGLSPIFG
jgi:hypothetical protein